MLCTERVRAFEPSHAMTVVQLTFLTSYHEELYFSPEIYGVEDIRSRNPANIYVR